jgi:hypothetical protein
MLHARNVSTVAVVAMTIGAVVVLPAGAQTPPLPIAAPTDAEARRVVASYNAANQRNNDTLDTEGQAAIESAPIQLVDDATFREVRGRGDTSLHERPSVDQVRVYVPVQSSSPLQFMATERVSANGGTFRQVLVFVKASESEPWRVSMAAQSSARPGLPKPLRTRDGAAALLDADHAATLLATPETLSQSLADLWAREAGEERAPGKVFAAGPLTTGGVDRLVNELSQLGINALVDFEFEAAQYPVIAYRAAGGGAVCLFTVSIRETIRPGVGDDRLVQPRSRETFTGLVVPGDYREVRFDRLAIAAVTIPERGGDARVEVVGFYDGAIAATGVPAEAAAVVGVQ